MPTQWPKSYFLLNPSIGKCIKCIVNNGLNIPLMAKSLLDIKIELKIHWFLANTFIRSFTPVSSHSTNTTEHLPCRRHCARWIPPERKEEEWSVLWVWVSVCGMTVYELYNAYMMKQTWRTIWTKRDCCSKRSAPGDGSSPRGFWAVSKTNVDWPTRVVVGAQNRMMGRARSRSQRQDTVHQ